jgi:hypothetical protein
MNFWNIFCSLDSALSLSLSLTNSVWEKTNNFFCAGMQIQRQRPTTRPAKEIEIQWPNFQYKFFFVFSQPTTETEQRKVEKLYKNNLL